MASSIPLFSYPSHFKFSPVHCTGVRRIVCLFCSKARPSNKFLSNQNVFILRNKSERFLQLHSIVHEDCRLPGNNRRFVKDEFFILQASPVFRMEAASFSETSVTNYHRQHGTSRNTNHKVELR